MRHDDEAERYAISTPNAHPYVARVHTVSMVLGIFGLMFGTTCVCVYVFEGFEGYMGRGEEMSLDGIFDLWGRKRQSQRAKPAVVIRVSSIEFYMDCRNLMREYAIGESA